jgi:hypothetical protein
MATVYIYADINIPQNFGAGSAFITTPAGNWGVVSLMALASLVAGGVATSDVETIIELNQIEHLKASDSGKVEPLFVGGTQLKVTVTKKLTTMSAVFVRVILTLDQR